MATNQQEPFIYDYDQMRPFNRLDHGPCNIRQLEELKSIYINAGKEFSDVLHQINEGVITEDQASSLIKEKNCYEINLREIYFTYALNFWRANDNDPEILNRCITDDVILKFIPWLIEKRGFLEKIVTSLSQDERTLQQEDNFLFRFIVTTLKHDNCYDTFFSIINEFCDLYTNNEAQHIKHENLIASMKLIKITNDEENGNFAFTQDFKQVISIADDKRKEKLLLMAFITHNKPLSKLLIDNINKYKQNEEKLKHTLSCIFISVAKKGHIQAVEELISIAKKKGPDDTFTVLSQLLAFDKAKALILAIRYNQTEVVLKIITTALDILTQIKSEAYESMNCLYQVIDSFFVGLCETSKLEPPRFDLLGQIIIHGPIIDLLEQAIKRDHLEAVKIILNVAKHPNNHHQLVYVLTAHDYQLLKCAALAYRVDILHKLLLSLKDIERTNVALEAIKKHLDEKTLVHLLLKDEHYKLSEFYLFMIEKPLSTFIPDAIAIVKNDMPLEDQGKGILNIIHWFISSTDQPLSLEETVQILELILELCEKNQKLAVINYLLGVYVKKAPFSLQLMIAEPSSYRDLNIEDGYKKTIKLIEAAEAARSEIEKSAHNNQIEQRQKPEEHEEHEEPTKTHQRQRFF